MLDEKYLPPVMASHPILNRDYIDGEFFNPVMDRYYSTLNEQSKSVFFDVFSVQGAISSANNSRLNQSLDIVASVIDKVCYLVDNDFNSDFDLGPDCLNYSHSDMRLLEERLSLLVAPLNLGRINSLQDQLYDQDLTDDQEQSVFDLFAPVICESLGELVKVHGFECMDNRKNLILLRDKVVSKLVSQV